MVLNLEENPVYSCIQAKIRPFVDLEIKSNVYLLLEHFDSARMTSDPVLKIQPNFDWLMLLQL